MVDDDATNLEVLRVRLSAQGYEVVTAVDGESGARELSEQLRVIWPSSGWDSSGPREHRADLLQMMALLHGVPAHIFANGGIIVGMALAHATHRRTRICPGVQ